MEGSHLLCRVLRASIFQINEFFPYQHPVRVGCGGRCGPRLRWVLPPQDERSESTSNEIKTPADEV
jgi:hypothetical protein